MNKDRVTIDQLALLVLLVIAGGKYLSLPSVLAGDVGHDSWLVFVVAFVWDAVCLVFLLWAIKINKDAQLGISEIFNHTVTKYVGKVFYLLFFVMFVIRSNVLLVSCYKMFVVNFDVSTNWLVYVAPVAIVAFVVVKLGFNSIARTGQLLFSLVIIAILSLVLAPLAEVEFSSLLPIGEAGWGNIVETTFLRSFWFSDYIFVYFVFDSIKVKKRVFSPVLVAFAVGAVITVLMNVVFVAISGSLAQDFDLAMGKIGIFSVSTSTDGRWDWLTLSVWLIAVFLKIVIFIFCAYKCIEKLVCCKFTKVNPVAVAVISLTLLVPMFVPFESVLENVIPVVLIPFAVMQYLLPLFMPLLTKIAVRRTEVKNNG